MRRLAVLTAIFACLPLPVLAQESAPPASAQPAFYPGDYLVCDGFPPPDDDGDGISLSHRAEVPIFLARADIVSSNRNFSEQATRFSPAGLRACNRLLAAQASLPEAFHQRRANLMQHRGLHQMNEGNVQAGIDDLLLAEAEALRAPESLLQRSLAVSNRLFRARALFELGRSAEARELLAEARARRPLSLQVGLVAAQLEYADDRDAAIYQQRLQELATYNPDIRHSLFMTALANGDLDTAIRTQQVVDYTPPDERFSNYWRVGFDQIVTGLQMSEAAGNYMAATALALRGSDDQAAALQAEVERTIAGLQADLPLLPNGRRPPRQQREVHELRQSALPQLLELQAQAQTSIERVRLARAGDLPGFAALASAASLSVRSLDLATMHLLLANLSDPEQRLAVERQLAALAALPDKGIPHIEPVTLDSIYNVIPGPETVGTLPRYRSGRGWLGEIIGPGHVDRVTGDVTRIHFSGLYASATVVEEMALLRAAHLTVERGHTHFAMVSKNLNRRYVVRPSGAYTDRLTQDEGFTAEISMISFGAEGPPANYAALDHLRIDAAQVIAVLEPVYVQPDD